MYLTVRFAAKYSAPAGGGGESCTFGVVELTRTVKPFPRLFAVLIGIGRARVRPGATGTNVALTRMLRAPEASL